MAEIPSTGIWEFLFERDQLPFPPDHVIFESSSRQLSYTYQDVKARARQFGHSLQRSDWGWRKGDVLMVMSPNSVEVPALVWGCHYAGGIVAPINPELLAADLYQQLTSSGAKGLVVHPQCLETALRAFELGDLSNVHLLALGENSHGVQTTAGFTKGSRTAATLKSVGHTPVNPTEDLAYLVYSSGTTGKPKAVMITHRNVVAAVLLQARVEGPHVSWQHDKTLAVLPIYHIYGLICLVHLPMWLGTTTTYMEKYQLDAFCRIMQEHAITHAYVAPPIVLRLAKEPAVQSYNLASLRMLTSGGAPLAAALIEELYQKAQIPVRQAYGLSETTSVSHIQPRNSWMDNIGSNGPPLPGLQAKFVCADNSEAKAGEEGELWVRGPTVFVGYRNEPAMTADTITPDGWFKTGDIGYEDEGGNLYITDRSKDMIKYKGYQIAPAELEDILLHHPAVADAAVVSIINSHLQTEVPLAYVKLKDKSNETVKTARDVISHVNSRVIHYKQLRGGVIWTSEIPKTSSGKIRKRELRDQARGVDQGKQVGAVDYAMYRKQKI
ncbi:hypothetical protein BDW75DRAFT_245644 [Aspergillus navahoensis]